VDYKQHRKKQRCPYSQNLSAGTMEDDILNLAGQCPEIIRTSYPVSASLKVSSLGHSDLWLQLSLESKYCLILQNSRASGLGLNVKAFCETNSDVMMFQLWSLIPL